MGWIDMGGNRMFVPGGTTPYSYDSGYDNSDRNWDAYQRRMQQEQEAAERERMMQNLARRGGNVTNNYYGGGGRRGGYTDEILKNVFGHPEFTGAPQGSEFGGYSYKARGSTPDYHREMPMGGTPGVYAIRNDELFGPRRGRFDGLARLMRDRNRDRFGFRR